MPPVPTGLKPEKEYQIRLTLTNKEEIFMSFDSKNDRDERFKQIIKNITCNELTMIGEAIVCRSDAVLKINKGYGFKTD